MSWEVDRARFVGKSGRVQRKAEAVYRMENAFNDYCEVLDSVLVGANLFSAVRNNRNGEVFGAVLTLDIEHETVWYRLETEDMGPVVGGCPDAILKLLTPTDNEHAIEWRNRKGRSV